MKYSISFKSADGRTEHSEFSPFENDVDAVAYAQSNASRSAIVEVWKGDALVTRLLPVTSARAS